MIRQFSGLEQLPILLQEISSLTFQFYHEFEQKSTVKLWGKI